MLMDVHLLGWRQATLGHLRNMDEAVLVDSQVDKRAKLRHIGDDAVKFHALTQILDVVHIVIKFTYLNG